MPFDPALFYAQAQRLTRSAESEADHRSAISRAYYACHLVARDALFGVDARGGRRPSHWAIIESVAKTEGYDDDANELWRLKRMREVADYVTDSLHSRVQEQFGAASVSDWEGLAAAALNVAGAPPTATGEGTAPRHSSESGNLPLCVPASLAPLPLPPPKNPPGESPPCPNLTKSANSRPCAEHSFRYLALSCAQAAIIAYSCPMAAGKRLIDRRRGAP